VVSHISPDRPHSLRLSNLYCRTLLHGLYILCIMCLNQFDSCALIPQRKYEKCIFFWHRIFILFILVRPSELCCFLSFDIRFPKYAGLSAVFQSILMQNPITVFLRKILYLTNIVHGAESFLRCNLSLIYSRISQHFVEPEGSLLCSQEPSTGSHPEPH
jgi:hypothetical protein